ncbi:MAG: hypothetical protein WBC06_17265 [Chitinophagaceae bacterium]
MEQNQNSSLFSLNLDAQNSYTLRSAASWARVLGIAGLILGVLFILLGIMVQQTVSKYGGYSSYRTSGLSANAIGNAGLAVYVIIGLMFVISSIFAINGGNKITTGLKTNDQASLSAGFAGVRNYFAFWAIITIIMLLFVFIGLLGSM